MKQALHPQKALFNLALILNKMKHFHYDMHFLAIKFNYSIISSRIIPFNAIF